VISVVQRCSQANVNVGGNTIGEIGIGFVVLLGIQKNDSVSDADYIVKKLSTLRIFSDSNEKMNLSIKDIEGSALIISQFTLFGDTRKGRRPSFVNAELPEKGKELYNYFLSRFKKEGIQIQTGEYGAMMEVSLINNGPVTLILNSRDR
tara:strand:+ start:15831 stop:16277 length:447 start_codon:yes stop_codon:yes gene_type:complete